MAIDPVLSLAFSIHANPGVYSILLGSGISRAAGIPTGWDIVLDLIGKISEVEGETSSPDPEVWYRAKFGEEPNYSRIIESLAKSPAERSQFLKRYLEPTAQEREDGLKIPTAAHKAIAGLAARGYIRAVITTNFDRLLEKALEEKGISPTVISTTDSIKGSLPLMHTRFVLIKVHGDYLDTRIKNSPAELGTYDEPMNQLLDRIFDEFGLIICGWSGEWDTALCSALERCRSRTFATYWTSKGDPTELAKRLIQQRQATLITIKDADSFFYDLEQKVLSLIEIDKAHPISAAVAAATLKRYLSDDHNRIQTHDLIFNEANRLHEEFSSDKYSLETPFNFEEYTRRVRQYESSLEILLYLILVGCYWQNAQYDKWWAKCLERVVPPKKGSRSINVWNNLRYYPASILLYAGGISSIVSNNYRCFASLLTLPTNEERDREEPLLLQLAPRRIIGDKEAEILFQKLTNEHLERLLRGPLKEYLPSDVEYIKTFDRFEYLFTLVYADLNEKRHNRIWAPTGCFLWRNRDEHEKHIINRVRAEISEQGENWPLLKAGLFNGSLTRFNYIEAEYIKAFRELPYF